MFWHILTLLVLAGFAAGFAYGAVRIWDHEETFGHTIVATLMGEAVVWFLIVLVTQIAQDTGGLQFPAIWPMFWRVALIVLLAVTAYMLFRHGRSDLHYVGIIVLLGIMVLLAISFYSAIDHAIVAFNQIQMHGVKAKPHKAT